MPAPKNVGVGFLGCAITRIAAASTHARRRIERDAPGHRIGRTGVRITPATSAPATLTFAVSCSGARSGGRRHDRRAHCVFAHGATFESENVPSARIVSAPCGPMNMPPGVHGHQHHVAAARRRPLASTADPEMVAVLVGLRMMSMPVVICPAATLTFNASAELVVPRIVGRRVAMCGRRRRQGQSSSHVAG